MKAWIAFALGWLCQTTVWADPLQPLFNAALSHDATYMAARAELASAQQNLPLARALMRPNLSLSLSDTQVKGSRTADNILGQPVTSELDYRAPVQSLNLRAPLFNREGSKKVQLAQLQVQFAEAVFAARKLELLDRLMTAYLQRLLSEQSWRLARAHVGAAQAQHEEARQKLRKGEGTTPEVADAQAVLDLAKIALLEAQNQREVDDLNLRQITGLTLAFQPTADVAPALLNGLTKRSVDLAPLAVWLTKAEANNPTLTARRYAVDMAQAAIARNGAGHYPRLDFVASATHASNESLSTLNQSASQRSLGLQLNVPLYSGGYVSAAVTQALADSDKAQAELLATQRGIVIDVTKAHLGVASGLAKIAAQDKAVDSSNLALTAARKGASTGFNTQADVLVAQRRLMQAQRDRTQALIDYLLAKVRLMARAGTDPAEVVSELDAIWPVH